MSDALYSLFTIFCSICSHRSRVNILIGRMQPYFHLHRRRRFTCFFALPFHNCRTRSFCQSRYFLRKITVASHVSHSGNGRGILQSNTSETIMSSSVLDRYRIHQPPALRRRVFIHHGMGWSTGYFMGLTLSRLFYKSVSYLFINKRPNLYFRLWPSRKRNVSMTRVITLP